MPVYSSDGALLEEDSWSERSANMANEYIRRFFERPEWLGWCRDAASGPLGQHVESLLANDEAEFLLFLDQVHIRPDTLDAPLRDDPSMPGLRRLLDSLYIGLAEAERIGGYLAAQSDRQATLDRQRRVLDGVHSLLTASDRERLRDVMRQAHGLDLDDPISTDIEPDGDGHRRELRILEALTLVETEASRNPNTRLRSAVIEWKNRNFHRLGFRDIEDLVIRYHGTEIVVNIAKCREIAANPGKFFPEWKTTQPFLGFVQTLRTAIEGSSMANAAKEAYARRAIALLKLDMAKLEQLISPDRPPVSAPAPTPAVVIALPEEVPADVPVVGVVRTSDAPVVEAPAEPLEAGEPA